MMNTCKKVREELKMKKERRLKLTGEQALLDAADPVDGRVQRDALPRC